MSEKKKEETFKYIHSIHKDASMHSRLIWKVKSEKWSSIY